MEFSGYSLWLSISRLKSFAIFPLLLGYTIQCSLLVKLGGLGIRFAQDIALPAFLPSLYSSCDSMPNCFQLSEFGVSSALAKWTEQSGTNICPEQPQKQKSWDLPLCHIKLNHLLESCSSTLKKFHLLAVSAPHSSHWLNAVPVSSLGLILDNTSFRIAHALQLGSPLCHSHECTCRTHVESVGVHWLSCKKSVGRSLAIHM